MDANPHPPLGDVSCRATGYAIQQLQRMKLPTAHVTRGLAYTLDNLQDQAASISWDDYLVFFRNSHCDLPTEKFVELCTSYQGSPYLRPLLSAAGLWFHPARYFERLADPESGAMRQLYRCVRTRFTQLSDLELLFEEVVEPGFAMPPDFFWEAHSIGLGALTTYFGLAPAIVTWEPIERGAAFRVRLPRRRPVRFALSWLASWFRRDTADDVRSALLFGHERSLRLEREISERKVAETALRESEERLSFALASADIGDWDMDLRTNVARRSLRHDQCFGHAEPVAEWGYDTFLAHVQPIDRDRVDAKYQAALAGNGDYDVEFRVAWPDGSLHWLWSKGRFYFDESGRPYRVAGIQVDITERKRAEQSLRASEERFGLAIRATNDAVWDIDPTNSTVHWSEKYTLAFGRPPETGDSWQWWIDHIHPDERDRTAGSLRAAVDGTVENWACDYRFRLPNGEWADIRDRAYISRDPAGKAVRVVGAMQDVTAFRRASAERDRIWTLSLDSMCVTGFDGYFKQVNPALEQTLDRTAQELTSRPLLDFVHPDDRQATVDAASQLIRGELLYHFENRYQHLDGSYRWLSWNVYPLAEAATMFGIARDVTEQKRAEETLRESEERLRVALRAAAAIGFVWNAASDAVVRYFSNVPSLPVNVDAPESVAAVRARVHPDDVGLFDGGVANCLGEGSDYRNLYRVVDPGGAIRWLQEWGHLSRDAAGRPLRLTGISIDVSDRKRVEVAVRESEERLRLALTAGRMGIFDWDLATNAVVWSDTHYELFGYPAGERFPVEYRHFIDRIHPDDRSAVERALRAAMESGAPYQNEARVLFPDGTIRWVMGAGEFRYDSDGRPVRMLGTVSEITDRKQAEEALLASEARARAIINSCPVPMALNDHSQRITFINLAFTRTFGYGMADIPTLADWWPKAYPDPAYRQWVAEAWQAELTRSVQTGTAFAIMDVTIRCKDGTDRFVAANAAALADTFAGTHLVVLHDITERQQADAALQESEERLRIFVESAPVGVAMFDRDMKYISYSRRWLTDYGLGDQNLIGRSHYEVFPEIMDQWKEIHRRCLTGVSERCEQDQVERADGSVHYFRWEIQPWTDATGAVGGLVFFTEMITDRVRAEDQVRASLREKEAMLKEIHHRVKNNLQVISSLLSLQAARVTNPAATDVLAESQNRVTAMALVHETLYRSANLARVDLSQYLGELCGYLFRTYGVDSARIRLELDVELVTVSLDKTIPCGLIVNEIVSNSLKYAFPGARSGTVTVGARTRPDGQLALTLSDDGVGLPIDLVIDNIPTLGLQLVNILTEQLGGQLTLDRFGGTQFDLSFTP